MNRKPIAIAYFLRILLEEYILVFQQERNNCTPNNFRDNSLRLTLTVNKLYAPETNEIHTGTSGYAHMHYTNRTIDLRRRTARFFLGRRRRR